MDLVGVTSTCQEEEVPPIDIPFPGCPTDICRHSELLRKEGKQNKVASCAGLWKLTVTLIHCCHNSIIFRLCACITDRYKQCTQEQVIKINYMLPFDVTMAKTFK